jgi:hypothetical protein
MTLKISVLRDKLGREIKSAEYQCVDGTQANVESTKLTLNGLVRSGQGPGVIWMESG